ncbi:beta-1,3-glucanase family protein [Streptacidiphilus carbonis]|uniref:beta-1,3-glucanase family protein n=1 Tax=Streptacidiphilus carbonis TaxID=105422 RepID=UPI0005AB44A1|nr:beta-1,3-glucanase family protein [Streptacidiphilus carbonis]
MISRRKLISASIAAVAAPVLLTTVRRTASASTAATLPVQLANNTSSATVYAYVLGLDLNQGNSWAFLQSDGSTLYHPPSPSAPGAALGADCAIALSAPGAPARTIYVPHLASGRIYFSVGKKLTFLVNPGPGIAMPSVSNPSDPNIATPYSFCEFTYDTNQLYANISYVDFASVPISFDLQTPQGEQTVNGLPAGGLETVASALRAQAASDGGDWAKLIVTDASGAALRVLSPNTAITSTPSLFSGYLDSYIDQVWTKYQSTDLVIDTQASWGSTTGRVSNGVLNFPGVGSFTKPSTAAVFNCSSAPFTTGNDEMGNLSARLAAALNRTTLLADANQPDGEDPSAFYQQPRTNHYARILHQTATDHLGYAFPYDDVHPAGVDFEGRVQSASPTSLTISVGAGQGGSGGSTATPTPTPTATATAGGGTSAFGTIQAESFAGQSGTATEACGDTGGGQDVGWIANGDWLSYDDIDFGSAGATQFQARVASGAAAGVSGLIQIRLASPTGPVVGSLSVGNTGGWQSWRTVPAAISGATGTHTVCLTFSSGQAADFVNLNWFTFKAS